MHCSVFLFFVHVNIRLFCVDHYRLWLNKRAENLWGFFCVCVCQKNHQLISKMCHILVFSEQSTVGINWIWFLNKFIIDEWWSCVCFWVITCQVTQKECWTCFGESVGGRKDIRRCMMGRGSVTMRTHQERRVCILLPNKQQLDRPVRVRTLSEWLFCDIWHIFISLTLVILFDL